MEWFLNLDDSSKITLITSIITAIVSIVSVIIATLALLTTKKSIQEANRPYVIIFIESVDVGFHAKYLVIKNFGNTGCYINKLILNQNFSDESFNMFLKNLENKFIAPEQSFVTYLDIEPNEGNIVFDINYSDSSKKYSETFNLDASIFKNQISIAQDLSNVSDGINSLNNLFHEKIKSRL